MVRATMRCPKCGTKLRIADAIRGSSEAQGVTCWQCGFWADDYTETITEDVMAKDRDPKRLCKVDGCKKYISKEDYCRQHWSEIYGASAPVPAPPVKEVKPVVVEEYDWTKTVERLQARGYVVEELSAPEPVDGFHVSDHETHLVNLIDIFDSALNEKRKQFISGLNSISCLSDKLQYALEYVRECSL